MADFRDCGRCVQKCAKHPVGRQKQAGPAGDLPDRGRHFGKRACKPNSVVCGHSSRRRVAADAHKRPTRRFRQLLEPPVAYRADTLRSLVLAACASLPIWSCSVWGLPCLTLYSGSGALLPHLFTLTPARRKQASCGMSPRPRKGAEESSRGGIFSVALAVHVCQESPLDAHVPDVIRHTALRSSDFPPPVYSFRRNRQRPPSSLAVHILRRYLSHQLRYGS